MGTRVRPKGPRIMKLLLFQASVVGFWCFGTVCSEVLTPPYFNLAQGRRIDATATCGEKIEEPELYCKLVGATSDTDDNPNVIHGQYCDYCEKGDKGRSHPPEHAIDGSERWWQSPPLSRGVKFNEVNLTIDLGQEFHVAYVVITMANSPRPGVFVLERSTDNGETYHPWQYFAGNAGECDKFFGRSTMHITGDDSVICETKYSKVVPLEGGEIFVSLIKERPSATDFFSSTVLQEWTRATNVRFRFLRTNTLLGHLMSVARQDPSVTRRYFYSIKDISIGGRCRCNGHADRCDQDDPVDPYKRLCDCQHHTVGAQCQECEYPYLQKRWRPATYSKPFVCEKCNCHGHTDNCRYDEEVDANKTSLDLDGNYDGGGVCVNCGDNTAGINCHECMPTFYRPYGVPLDAYDVCKPCNCNMFYSTGNCSVGSGRCECAKNYLPPNCESCNNGYYGYPDCNPCDCHFMGTQGQVCEVGGGQCPCKRNYAGKNCSICADGFYNFPECLACECEEFGSVSSVCDLDNGQCECGNNFGGRQCNECENGYYNFPTCTYCTCDVQGTREGICHKGSGECLCREGYGGARCDQCLQGYYGYPDCKTCNCSSVGSASTVCDATGKCPCLPNFSGRACDQCTPGYYQYPECLPCGCQEEGSMGVSCDDEGKCQCKISFDGLRCEECKEGFYNFPLCEECNCDPAGVVETFSGCGDSPPGELCKCKERVTGRICNECKPLFWNLQQWNPTGCEDCDCFGPGIIGGVRVCEGKTGQCPCKSNVFSPKCEDCVDGYYNLTSENIFGCSDCGCDVGGSVNNICDKRNGQCPCRPRIAGLQCTSPLQTHYVPTLYQFQYEAEDGTTPSMGQVRFGYEEDLFPEYSWRGYAVYSQLQPETNHEVQIEKSSIYRVVIRYANPGNQTVIGEIKVTPDNPNDAEQSYKVRFEPRGGFLTVSQGNIPSPFVLNPGRWLLSLKSDQYLLIDYFTLLPAAYYEGTILVKSVNQPCFVNTTVRGRANSIFPDPCLKYKYPGLDKFDSVRVSEGFNMIEGDKADLNNFYNDNKVLEVLDIPGENLAVLGQQQSEISLELPVSKGGRYALVLEYFTPQGANLTNIGVESTSRKGMTKGRALIHNCTITTLCRQVITTEEGEVAVFRFDQSSINLVLKGDPDSMDKIALHTITAIPLGKWSLDHIRLKEYCVVKNGTCATSSYLVPPDSTKVEAESTEPERVSDKDNLPEGVSDKNLILLDSQKRSVEINGRVPNPGYYTFLVHYHQPENPEFFVEVVLKNGQHYIARLPIVHCPSTAGCRAQAVQDDKNTRFYIQDDFMLTLKSPRNVWVDYVLAVPADQESTNELDQYLHQSPLDETRKFIAECGKSHFNLKGNASQFCKDAVFSLTSDYNNGALPCQCDFYGSTAFECVQFGGQCPCKENVIGRRCERCKTGFYGFPNCKPCSCPSTLLCDTLSGACICPPRVVGDKCDTCAPFTYGFDSFIGCVDCNCNALGVRDGNLQCELETGQCECRTNVVSRTCEKCKAGYWAFPYCQLCNCDMRGTTEDICNQDSSQCNCKANVEGGMCDQCKSGSFNLQEMNPAGCTKCFCFGKTTRCTQSYLFWTPISFGVSHWTSVMFDPNEPNALEIGYGIEFEDVSGEDDGAFVPFYTPEYSIPEGDASKVLYFRVSVDSNHLASFGGQLSYTMVSEPDDNADRETFPGPEVILEGAELSPSSGVIRLLHFAVDHLDGDHKMNMNLQLTEGNFAVASPTGGLVSATRDQMMVVMKGLKAIYVRAGYWQSIREARLSSFGLEIANEDYNYRPQEDRAVTVEQCQCPPNYQGLSCEECAPGYYRSPSGPFGGFCVPCQCNGHSDTCDPVSGVCLDCKHNSTGDHCDQCEEGYHGDASQGTPYDCLICACPLPMVSNNFATSCELSRDGYEISCQCKDGYLGPRCEGCGPGFYGRPEVPGDYCKPCGCSGNIDPTDPYSCDTVTGACLRCMNNTGGPACNLCARGFYGDALLTKDCQKCSCNECGTYECENDSGNCDCLNNVVGYQCDRCAPDFFGMARCDGTGCHYCECGIASESTQCDDLTGDCPCRKGTTGRRCERCSPGYWNYTEDGCQSCECNQEYAIGVGCDPETGQCSCLPGVVGEKCDRCPHRWVLIEDRGCQQCDPCQHQLLDSTDEMAAILDPVKDDFDSVAVSYFTTQKLAYFNETANALQPNVQLLDPSKVDLSPYYDSTQKLETEVSSQRQKSEVISDRIRDKSDQSGKLRDKAFEVESKVQEAVAKARTTVFETKDLMEGLLAEEKPVSSPQTDAAKAEAEAIINSMQNAKFDPTAALEENNTATTVLKDVKKFVRPLGKLNNDLKKSSDRIMEVKEKLQDLRTRSMESVETSKKANEISNKIKEARFPAKLSVLEGKASDMLDNIEIASGANTNASDLIDPLDNAFLELDTGVRSVKQLKIPLSENLQTLIDELDRNKDTIPISQEHARKLKEEADELDDMLGDTRRFSEQGVAAATAFRKIVDALNEAHEAADQAKAAADNTSDITAGIDEDAKVVIEPSHNLLIQAGDSLKQVEEDLKIPLKDSKRAIRDVESMNNITAYSLGNLKMELDRLSVPTDLSDLQTSVSTSSDASQTAEESQAEVEDILKNLPQHTAKLRELRVTVQDLNSGVDLSDNQLKQAKESIPLSAAITGNLESMKPNFDDKKTSIASELSNLKAQIAAAREQANRVPVGLILQDSSSLLLANPQSLESQQAQTKVSFHFKTQDDGILFYLGNEPGRKGEEDFMAVEVVGGYPVLSLDLGSGPQKITNEKFVTDNQWHKATVERAGKAVKFTIASEDPSGNVDESSKEDYLPGSKSLFNVDRNSSRLYVGGLPQGQTKSPVKYSTFRGTIEDLIIGDEKVGLWNFKDAQNIYPAQARDRFVNLQTERGLRFQGNGYAILNKTLFQYKDQSALILKFKTRSKNGLLFLVGKGKKFMSVELTNGAILFQYDLGGGVAKLQTPETYNDGQWHEISGVRYHQDAKLNVDGREIIRSSSPGRQIQLVVSDYMYFGGYPGEHGYPSVSTKPFEGCIDGVNIDGTLLDLTQAVESRYTSVGCPSSQFTPTIATFFGEGYLQVSSADSPVTGPQIVTRDDDSFEVNFRFRSNASEGLLFYGTDAGQDNFLSVTMSEGSLYIKTEPGTAQIRTDHLNDADWHVLTITRDKNKLTVNVDDRNEYTESAPNGPIQLSTAGSILFFGGRPDDYPLRDGALVSDTQYSGCIADISVNGKRLDFSDSVIKDASVSQKCVTAQEKDAMALTDSQTNSGTGGSRTIPKYEEDPDEEDSPPPARTTPTTTSTSTTTTTEPINFDALSRPIGGSSRESDSFETPEEEEPTTKKPKKADDDEVLPTPFMKCALPYRDLPPDDEEISMDSGVRFGSTDKTSRLEYLRQSEEDESRSEYSIDFKTSSPHGLIFMWTEFDKMDFLALFIRKGFLHFAFDSGSGTAYMNSTIMYNDTKWHTATFSRQKTQGVLTVDGTAVATGESSGSTTSVNAGNTMYIGGLPQEGWVKKMTLKKLMQVDSPFRGCLRNFVVKNKAPAAPSYRHSVQPCRDEVEDGYFFYPDAGYLQLHKTFKAGRNIKLSMSIKPRHPSGILMSVHGDKDYMVLQMINGTVKFAVDNGKGQISSAFSKEPYDLCDGNWHTIRVTKSKNVVTLAIDNTYSKPGIGAAGKDMTNTQHPLYLGGHPNPQTAKGLETTDQFVGCLKDFVIEGREFKINHDSIVGKVGLYTCPTN